MRVPSKQSPAAADEVLELMGRIPLYSRGPKTTGAIRAAGLREYAAATSEASPELLEMLVDRGVEGLTSCVQTQGPGSGWNPMAPLLDGLRSAGAEVIEVPVYRWELPDDLRALDELKVGRQPISTELDAARSVSC